MGDPRSPVSGVIGLLNAGSRMSAERDKQRLNEIDGRMIRLAQEGKMDSKEYQELKTEQDSIFSKYD